MLRNFTTVKNKIIEALESLPREITVPINGQLNVIDIEDTVISDINNLNDYWEFNAKYGNKNIVALIGMVNAGKSAIGNLLINQKESAIFQEAPIRETSKPTIATLDNETILVDLPGLGSVLSEEDDKIVKSYIYRANILLIIISVDSPITRHLYEFIKQDTIKTKEAQRILIVLNKTDIWDMLPDSHAEKELIKIQDFLLNGDKKAGFNGIKELFNYDISILSFSVKKTRKNNNIEALLNLKKVLKKNLSNSQNIKLRLTADLHSYIIRYSILHNQFIEVTNEIENAKSQYEWIAEKIGETINNEMSALFSMLWEIDKACWLDMQKISSPGFFERIFDNFDYLKSQLRDVRETYQKKMKGQINSSLSRMTLNITKIITNAFDNCPTMTTPSKNKIHEISNEVIYVNWDVVDDIKFREKNVSSSTINSRTKDKMTKLGEAIDSWLSELSISETLEQAITYKYREYFESYSQLENFAKNFAEANILLEKAK